MPIIYKRLLEFFIWLGASILATYYVPEIIRTGFYILLLVAYFRSKNEAMFLALFLVLNDGFWGFFNNYEVVLGIIPGLPPIEIGHLYIALTIVKAAKRTFEPPPLFYKAFMLTLAVYVVFLVVQGHMLGLAPQMNIRFRVVKHIFPLMLFYSIPRLFPTERDYREIFFYIFPMAFAALFAQVFTITTGTTPSQFLGVHRDFWFTVDVNKGKTYRGFYSTGVILISFFGAMYYLAHKEKSFNFIYLFAILAANFLSVFLSATRGWLLGLGFPLILFLIFVLKLSAQNLAKIGVTTIVLTGGLMLIPVVGKQFTNAVLRFTTLEKLAAGDVTAGGTLERLDKRAPPVVDKWEESPLTGWGFSDDFMEVQDFHVGNQNILMHSGILGGLLMLMFFIYYHFKLFARSRILPKDNPLREALLVFVVFFPGWFMIHSSSGQHFAYYLDPNNAMIQAIYFTLGGVAYKTTLPKKKRRQFQYTDTETSEPETQLETTIKSD
ncbi:MAG: O-antigen ligase family protein [Lewinellaceae bacterium]|nr:O-antigen ligase family protein [Saprospiraceae bacterium]MCB9330170.1 O-antigen ligase family protein [Lewinellaceae bacterium]